MSRRRGYFLGFGICLFAGTCALVPLLVMAMTGEPMGPPPETGGGKGGTLFRGAYAIGGETGVRLVFVGGVVFCCGGCIYYLWRALASPKAEVVLGEAAKGGRPGEPGGQRALRGPDVPHHTGRSRSSQSLTTSRPASPSSAVSQFQRLSCPRRRRPDA